MLSRQSAFACPEGSMPKCIRREGFFHVVLYLFFSWWNWKMSRSSKGNGTVESCTSINLELCVVENFLFYDCTYLLLFIKKILNTAKDVRELPPWTWLQNPHKLQYFLKYILYKNLLMALTLSMLFLVTMREGMIFIFEGLFKKFEIPSIFVIRLMVSGKNPLS